VLIVPRLKAYEGPQVTAANQYLADTFLPDWQERFTTSPPTQPTGAVFDTVLPCYADSQIAAQIRRLTALN
jgi:hypothetical protein